MADQRQKDKQWAVCGAHDTGATFEGAQLAVLMDIRDELKRLNLLLHCHNFTDLPRRSLES